jgi:hypothetical protein
MLGTRSVSDFRGFFFFFLEGVGNIDIEFKVLSTTNPKI